ncbi:small conductance mechanosensitive ion channel [Raphidocelis subcapitata]|uniref:Small conductance mechanosensitive ion channel n=1 Tax=Raphidocelis subcapitata TaxID=307507 RepID=A0A2V0PG77_9CHLO|nr:small conductance mechanosensitive ion channel [Raphidocelis subcapitata]|eukprot:GBF96207.1 small conductance mechanosensitive ion channel [Raphidocelis subcapitata]
MLDAGRAGQRPLGRARRGAPAAAPAAAARLPCRVPPPPPLLLRRAPPLLQRRGSVPLLKPSRAASGASSAGAASGQPQQPPQQQPAAPTPATPVAATTTGLKPILIVVFGALGLGALLISALSLFFTTDLGFGDAVARVTRRVFRSIAFRQLVVIAAALFLVRFALNNVLRLLAQWSRSPVPWDKSKLYYVMREVYSPLEVLLFVAGCCTIADSVLPQLIQVPKATVNAVVRAALSMGFVLGAATVVYNLTSRFCKEQAWQCEMQGNPTSQRRWEAYDKLATFGIYTLTIFFSIQALGLEVRSVLAIGGIGGLAIGLAGREICENILNGFLLMTTMPFEVGDEIIFYPNGQTVEGIVLDVGWYRTTIRSFEREVFVIPNAVFSKNTVLNVTRKLREWRFYEYIGVRVADVQRVNAIIQDIRRIVRNDARIINKLHRRIFLDKITHEDAQIYLSFYVEASNRDAFMAVKQDLLLAFVDCVERNGAKLATPRRVLEMDEASSPALVGLYSTAAAAAAARMGAVVPPPQPAVDVTASAVPIMASFASLDLAGGTTAAGAAAAAAAAAAGAGAGEGRDGAGKAAGGNGTAAAAGAAAGGGNGKAPAPAPSAQDGEAGARRRQQQQQQQRGLESRLRGFLQQLFTDDTRRGQQ